MSSDAEDLNNISGIGELVIRWDGIDEDGYDGTGTTATIWSRDET